MTGRKLALAVAFAVLLPVALSAEREPSYINGSECARMVALLRDTRDYVPAMRPCLGEEDSPAVIDILTQTPTRPE